MRRVSPKKDLTLKDPNCVFQLLRKQYARYTLDKVSSITGTPKEKLEEVYKTIGSTGKPNRVATVCYAMGWTQHTVGVQNIRAFSMIQLLLGNMGMAGGGINALRGESNVQGSTDYGLLFHILPGYNPTTDRYSCRPEDLQSKNSLPRRRKREASTGGVTGRSISRAI